MYVAKSAGRDRVERDEADEATAAEERREPPLCIKNQSSLPRSLSAQLRTPVQE